MTEPIFEGFCLKGVEMKMSVTTVTAWGVPAQHQDLLLLLFTMEEFPGLKLVFIYACICVYMCICRMCVCACGGLTRTIPKSCELDMAAGGWTWVLWKSSSALDYWVTFPASKESLSLRKKKSTIETKTIVICALFVLNKNIYIGVLGIAQWYINITVLTWLKPCI